MKKRKIVASLAIAAGIFGATALAVTESVPWFVGPLILALSAFAADQLVTGVARIRGLAVVLVLGVLGGAAIVAAKDPAGVAGFLPIFGASLTLVLVSPDEPDKAHCSVR